MVDQAWYEIGAARAARLPFRGDPSGDLGEKRRSQSGNGKPVWEYPVFKDSPSLMHCTQSKREPQSASGLDPFSWTPEQSGERSPRCPRQGRQLSHRQSLGNKQLAAINAVLVPISALSGMLLFVAFYGGDVFVHNLAAHRAEAHGRIPVPMIEIRASVSTHCHGLFSLRALLAHISSIAVMSLINRPFRPMAPSFRHNLRPAPTVTSFCHNVGMCR